MAYIRRQFKGNASYSDALLSGITNSTTAITLKDGTTFPDGSVGPFVVTIDPGNALEEKVLVTTRSGANLQSCTRAYDGTTAQVHAANAIVQHSISAVDLDEANQAAHQLLGGSSTNGQIPYVTGAGTYGFVAAPTAGQLLGYSAGVPGWIANGTYAALAGATFTGPVQTTALGVNTAPGATGTAKTANNMLDDGSGNLTAAGSITSSTGNNFIGSSSSVGTSLIAPAGQYIALRPNGNNATGNLTVLSSGRTYTNDGSGVVRNLLDDGAGAATFAGTVTAQELVTRTDKTSGALATTGSWVSGTGQQIDVSHDRFLSFNLVTTSAAGTCTVALSPDNVTYSNVGIITPAITAATVPFGLYVPKGWYVKLTFSNGTVAAGTFW